MSNIGNLDEDADADAVAALRCALGIGLMCGLWCSREKCVHRVSGERWAGGVVAQTSMRSHFFRLVDGFRLKRTRWHASE